MSGHVTERTVGLPLTVTVEVDRGAPRRVADRLVHVVGEQVRRDADDVRIAVHEVVANAVLHGGAPITVTASLEDQVVTITVVDAGPGPDPAAPRSGPAGERGRGMALIGATCDGVRVGRTPAGGTSVRLRFVRAAAGR